MFINKDSINKLKMSIFGSLVIATRGVISESILGIKKFNPKEK